jgi:hypothetical protein
MGQQSLCQASLIDANASNNSVVKGPEPLIRVKGGVKSQRVMVDGKCGSPWLSTVVGRQLDKMIT